MVRSASSTCRSWDLATSVTTPAPLSRSAATSGSSAAATPARRVAPNAASCACWRCELVAGAAEELGVLGVGAGPAALDEADAELVDVPGDVQLVERRRGQPLLLRAVAQGRVVDVEPGLGQSGVPDVVCRTKVPRDESPRHGRVTPGRTRQPIMTRWCARLSRTAPIGPRPIGGVRPAVQPAVRARPGRTGGRQRLPDRGGDRAGLARRPTQSTSPSDHASGPTGVTTAAVPQAKTSVIRPLRTPVAPLVDRDPALLDLVPEAAGELDDRGAGDRPRGSCR